MSARATDVDWREANRIILAWGPQAIAVSPGDRLLRTGDHPSGCRMPRQDGFACWGDRADDVDLCARHVDRRRTITGEAGLANAQFRARRSGDRTGVYFVLGADAVKIGMATDYRSRVASLQTGSPVKLTLHRFVSCFGARELEAFLHRRYHAHRLHGEWFTAAPVLADLATLSDEWMRARLLPGALPLEGTARDVARYFGTYSGRAALAVPVPLDVRIGPPASDDVGYDGPFITSQVLWGPE